MAAGNASQQVMNIVGSGKREMPSESHKEGVDVDAWILCGLMPRFCLISLSLIRAVLQYLR